MKFADFGLEFSQNNWTEFVYEKIIAQKLEISQNRWVKPLSIFGPKYRDLSVFWGKIEQFGNRSDCKRLDKFHVCSSCIILAHVTWYKFWISTDFHRQIWRPAQPRDGFWDGKPGFGRLCGREPAKGRTAAMRVVHSWILGSEQGDWLTGYAKVQKLHDLLPPETESTTRLHWICTQVLLQH